jgi:hypothetical protein
MPSEWRSLPLVTITLLGERADITRPDAAAPAAGQSTIAVFCRSQLVDDPTGHSSY